MTTAQARKGWKAWRKYCQDGLPVVVVRSLEPSLSPAKAPRKRRSASSARVQARKKSGKAVRLSGLLASFYDEPSALGQAESLSRTPVRAVLLTTVRILQAKSGVVVLVSCEKCGKEVPTFSSLSALRQNKLVKAWTCPCVVSSTPPISFMEE